MSFKSCYVSSFKIPSISDTDKCNTTDFNTTEINTREFNFEMSFIDIIRYTNLDNIDDKEWIINEYSTYLLEKFELYNELLITEIASHTYISKGVNELRNCHVILAYISVIDKNILMDNSLFFYINPQCVTIICEMLNIHNDKDYIYQCVIKGKYFIFLEQFAPYITNGMFDYLPNNNNWLKANQNKFVQISTSRFNNLQDDLDTEDFTTKCQI